MRALPILGPAVSSRHLKPFEHAGVDLSISENFTSATTDAVLVFGGDGTIHRQLPHLACTGIPLLVVPCGSGHDFARALGLRTPQESLAAWQRFLNGAGNVRDVDLGVVTPGVTAPGRAGASPETRNQKPQTFFCCVAGMGVDAEANRRANAMPQWLRAHGGYWLAALGAILSFQPQAIAVNAKGAAHLPAMNQSSMEESSISWM
ncbi:MAG: diacylglycerol/lipid kinase family protein, partial [Terriglobales bacterium]